MSTQTTAAISWERYQTAPGTSAHFAMRGSYIVGMVKYSAKGWTSRALVRGRWVDLGINQTSAEGRADVQRALNPTDA